MKPVRNGQIVVDTCNECGCRLDENKSHFDGSLYVLDMEDIFDRLRDARGCDCSIYKDELTGS